MRGGVSLVSTYSASVVAASCGHPPTSQDTRECVPELGTEHRIDDGVEGGVEVAEPEAGGDQVLVGGAGGRDAGRKHNGQDEERQPADDERAGDDGQRLGGLALAARVCIVTPDDGAWRQRALHSRRRCSQLSCHRRHLRLQAVAQRA